MSIAEVALVACGAALGAPVRWSVDVYAQRRWLSVFPWGTFAVNVIGSGLLGFLVASWSSDGVVATLFGIGFCGGLTTFSSFAWETHRLAEDGAHALATANALGTTLACCAAAALGWWVGG